MSTSDFSLATSIWNGDKFLLEAATASGAKQMKVTAEVVRAYLQGSGGASTDRRVLPFRGFIKSATILKASAATGILGIDVWYIQSEARFAATPRTGGLSLQPTTVYDNWETRPDYLDGRKPIEGNLYVCADDNRPYWWTGAELRPIVTDTTGTVIADSISLADIDAITTPQTDAAQQAAPQAAHSTQVALPSVQTSVAEAPSTTHSDTDTPRTVVVEDLTKRAAVISDLTKRAAKVSTVTRAATIVQEAPRAATVVQEAPRARVIVVG